MSPIARKCIAFVLSHEGGYVNHPDDRGGETNFGISKRSYPHLDIKNLTRDEAANLYHGDYWVPLRCDEMDIKIAATMLDTAVNCGKNLTALWLQQAINEALPVKNTIVADGVIGPRTLRALNTSTAYMEISDLVLVRRLTHYCALPKTLRDAFLTGWTFRVAKLISYRHAVAF